MPAADPAQPLHSPLCPRCDYDLAGSFAAWFPTTDTPGAACPTTCTCTECGLSFATADVLVPARATCPGLFDHATHNRLRALFTTCLWIIFPWVFWSRVKMHHRINLRRIIIPPLALIATLFLLDRVIMVAAHILATKFGNTINFIGTGPLDIPAWSSGHPLIAAAFPFVMNVGSGFRAGPGTFIGGMMLAANLMWPLLLLVLPHTRSTARIRKQHIYRAWAYSFWPLAAITVCMTLAFALDFLVCLDVAPDFTRQIRTIASFIAVACAWSGVVYVCHLAAWWSFALTRGWRIHGGWWVAVLLSFTSLLAALASFGSITIFLADP